MVGIIYRGRKIDWKIMKEPVVSIVGRPNVGKSTLFNRLLGRRQAIVDEEPGVTRDRNYAVAEWNGRSFILVDTGGYLPRSKSQIDLAVREQVEIAIDESDIILFVVDARTGITDIDMELAGKLTTSRQPVMLLVNKVDDERDEVEVGQFYKLGLGHPWPVSAMIGKRTGDMLDSLTSRFQVFKVADQDSEAIRIAVVGKENVGKSSLVNALLNQERQIVTEMPGTTRDAIDTRFSYQNQHYIMIDTAGLKKRRKIKENIIFYSNLRSYLSMHRCDVVLYMVSAEEGFSKQDLQVLVRAEQEKKGIICAFNKWDLVEKDQNTIARYSKDLKEKMGDLRYIPFIFISVIKKQRLYKTLDLVTQVFRERQKRIPTAELNEYLLSVIAKTTPPAIMGKEIKIKFISQLKTAPPLFALYGNHPDLIAEHYQRFLENKLREKFGFTGVPIRLIFKKK
jgi:GTP-binding protein